MPIHLYDYAPVLPVNVSRPYFSTRPQSCVKKSGLISFFDLMQSSASGEFLGCMVVVEMPGM